MTKLFPDSVLLIFCKAPVAGLVKTRLQPVLTPEQAVDVHRQLTRYTLGRAFEAPLCDVQLYCAPDARHGFFAQCINDYPLTLKTQQGDDLGARMHHALTGALAQYQHAILMGCDCPSLTWDDCRQALTALQQGLDLVVAPAEDGGYVLIGLNAPQPTLFENMHWGHGQVMAITRQRAANAALCVHELALQWDVDTVADWERFLAINNSGE